MRTLTLGVLIVCGGTLAALPFRRYQTIPDASAVPTQVTGPTQSALHASRGEANAVSSNSFTSPADSDRLNELCSNYDPSAFSTQKPLPVRRQIDIPLTYDDLAVPLDQPKPIMERFNATAAVREQQVEADRIAGLVMPSMESLPLAQRQQIASVAETVANQQDSYAPRAAGRLASSGQPAPARIDGSTARLDSLPPPQDVVERPKHWIRQPQ